MDFSHVRKMIQIIISCVLLTSVTNAVQLSRSGGYDLVIAVDQNAPAPSDITRYRNNVENMVRDFARVLAISTRQRFHLRSVDLLVPPSWQISSEIATFQEYATADIQVSPAFDAPRVENPNTCGAAGLRIELPLDFFNNSRLVDNYGEGGQALLNLFARYRYGVWEEHGEIGDSEFPYFHLETNEDPTWTFTGCSAHLQGSIRNEFREISDECLTRRPEGPADNCRFIPSPSNSVNSSITFLPWANGVTQFCDGHTHNHNAPNRQNLFCGHRSVWEVIRESEDFWSLTEDPDDSVRVPQFRVLTVSARPLFYLLLDRGRTSTPVGVLRDVVASLQGLYNDSTIDPDTIAAVGTYPHANEGRDHSYVREVAPWARIGSGEAFGKVIEEAVGLMDGPVERDFGEAIKEVVDKIKTRNHPAGAVILIVKRGATSNAFDHLTFFGDVLASIREQANLRVFAIEYQQAEKTPFVNLEPLIMQVDGSLLVLNETTGVREKLEPILSEVRTALEPGSGGSTREVGWTIYKGFPGINVPVEIPVLDDNLESVTICVITTKYVLASDIAIVQTRGTPRQSQRVTRNEWNEGSDTSKRSVTIVTIPNPAKDSVWEVKVSNCSSTSPADCTVFLIANAAVPSTLNDNQDSISSRDLSVEVLTSAENNFLDLDRHGARVVPFSIFAKVEVDGQRVLRLESVKASIIRHNREAWTIPLLDDGSHLPDVSRDDGIYSGVFTPPQDGLYNIYVTVTHHRVINEVSFDESTEVLSLGRLIPVDQSTFGCRGSTNRRCVAAPVSDSLARTFDISGSIYVAHSITFLPLPAKIVDFQGSLRPGFKVEFSFTSPSILGSDAQVDEFHIYEAPSVRDVVEGANLTLIETIAGVPSGERVTTEFDATLGMIDNIAKFFTVEAVYQDRKGGPSNVIPVIFTESGIPPTPNPSTTTTSTTTTVRSTTGGNPETTPEATATTRNPVTQSTTPSTTETLRSSTRSPNVASPSNAANWQITFIVLGSLFYIA